MEINRYPWSPVQVTTHTTLLYKHCVACRMPDRDIIKNGIESEHALNYPIHTHKWLPNKFVLRGTLEFHRDRKNDVRVTYTRADGRTRVSSAPATVSRLGSELVVQTASKTYRFNVRNANPHEQDQTRADNIFKKIQKLTPDPSMSSTGGLRRNRSHEHFLCIIEFGH